MAEHCYSQCHLRRVSHILMLSVVILNVVMLSVVILNVVMLNGFMLNVIMLSVTAPPSWSRKYCQEPNTLAIWAHM
jgi:hypothetical protein